MKFTRSNFKEAQRRARNMFNLYWRQYQENKELRQKNEELTAKYSYLIQHYLQQMQEYANFIKQTTEEKLPEVDLLIERTIADEEYLSKKMLETRYKLTNHRQN